ncbi:MULTISPECIES: hypothetical protein [Bacillus cereus group]|uniref:hypothetical protein n=1 Tax=Bacillus cereus group TaxID=86661 RepID=UPI0012387981|nr:hypothetical protein [Bacillus cereus]KAA6455674.1 hypothetical protein DX930_31455 [Bacillus cereus]KAB2417801.1 hypothetical protein F8169_05275 [Bacillus cereus]KAB2437768.1 hypothetical protein F8166_06670 [Bacillus cereus]KAB2469861.1 hypothetical protein F8164_05370 [Bacillus cereus]
MAIEFRAFDSALAILDKYHDSSSSPDYAIYEHIFPFSGNLISYSANINSIYVKPINPELNTPMGGFAISIHPRINPNDPKSVIGSQRLEIFDTKGNSIKKDQYRMSIDYTIIGLT